MHARLVRLRVGQARRELVGVSRRVVSILRGRCLHTGLLTWQGNLKAVRAWLHWQLALHQICTTSQTLLRHTLHVLGLHHRLVLLAGHWLLRVR
jgi:hypothetical protein